MEFSTYTLSNGLRIIHEPSKTNVVYCGFAIDAGTRDEEANEQGMAHFLEHMTFKGTEKRRAWHILNRMEAVGGDLNAYTGKEETVFYSAFLKEHLERAIELLADICLHSHFPQHEIDKEVEVIIDEIESYNDSPSELIYDDFENMIFHGHPLGRAILGKADRLREFTTSDAKNFQGRFYHPNNMIFFIHGDVKPEKVCRLVEKYMANESGGSPLYERKRLEIPAYVPQTIEHNKGTHQAHVMIGSRSYGAHDKRRTTLYVLNNMLGGPGMNSLLNLALRERRGLVYTVESNITNYTDTGVFSIYFGCDEEDIDRCINLTRKELQRLIDSPLSVSRLNAVKKQLKGQIGIACDNFENCALDMGKGFLHYNKFERLTDLFNRIEAITPQQLQEVAAEILSPERLSTLIYR